MTGRIAELGLNKCPICDGETIGIAERPAMLYIGGFLFEKDDPRRDPDANVVYAVDFTCQVCGYIMLFDSEKFHRGDAKILAFRDEDD
jgi:hypothetical protein